MDGGDDAGEIDIPVVMLSAADGEELLVERGSGGTVRATLGATQRSSFEISSFNFLVDPREIHPVAANNGDAIRVEVGIFADGLETGDATDWSIAVHERDAS